MGFPTPTLPLRRGAGRTQGAGEAGEGGIGASSQVVKASSQVGGVGGVGSVGGVGGAGVGVVYIYERLKTAEEDVLLFRLVVVISGSYVCVCVFMYTVV